MNSRQKASLSIVVPVYNGENTIGTLVKELTQLPIADELEIVLVNDCSPDDSLNRCRALAKESPVPITVVDLSRNFGEHNAIMAGLAQTTGDYVVTMDDDLQNPPGEVVRLYEYAKSHPYDVVYTHYAKKEHRWWRNLGSRFTNVLAGAMLDKPKGIYLSSFRCMNAFTVANILRYDGPFPYVDGIILQVTQRLGSLLVEHLPRASGESNYTLRRLVRLWLSMFLNFSVMPLRIGTLLGFLMAGAGVLVFINVILQRLFFGAPLGWGSIMAAVVIFSGVQLVTIGIAAEYLGRMYITLNRRPQYLVRNTYQSANGSSKVPSANRPVEVETSNAE